MWSDTVNALFYNRIQFVMNKELLRKHIANFAKKVDRNPVKHQEDRKERAEYIEFYQQYKRDKILQMDAEEVYKYLSPLWAMLIWGNKHYVVDKIIEDNGLDNFKEHLANLLWSDTPIEQRWDTFRNDIKGMGPAMISEVLSKTHPNEYTIWNRRAYVGLNYLEVENLPRYDYQLNGEVYRYLCDVSKEIAAEFERAGFEDTTLLAVDYFLWDELQVEENLSRIHTKKKSKTKEGKEVPEIKPPEESSFIHNDVRDKVRDIGQWLGFTAKIEQKVAEGSVVDTVWEASIGNMGRVIYVFEVQTKGSIDRLILNLLKAMNNPAVQGVVAVSDKGQLEKIQKHSSGVANLKDKLKYWNYEEVLRVHESLELVNSSINNLGLVPQGF